ncbi:MAG: hypothetical protein ABIC57_00590 [bacterium]
MNPEKDDFEGMLTEINAGRVLIPKAPEDYVWNDACLRAMSIITKYKEGRGLFQTRRKNNGD